MRRVNFELDHRHKGDTVDQELEQLKSTRKFVVPFLEYLDRVKFTARRGDLRVLHDAQSP